MEKKKKSGQGGWDFRSSGKRPQRAHPQLVHWWLLIHSSPVLGFRKWWTLYRRKMHPGFCAGSKETRRATVLGYYIIPFIAILYADHVSAPEVAQGEAHKEREREKKLTLRLRFCIISRVAARAPGRRPL